MPTAAVEPTDLRCYGAETLRTSELGAFCKLRGKRPFIAPICLAYSLDVAGQEPATIVSARPSATQSRSASGSSTAAVSLLIPMSMDPRQERSGTFQAVPP